MPYASKQKLISILAFLSTLGLAACLNATVPNATPPAAQRTPAPTSPLTATVMPTVADIGQPKSGDQQGLLQIYENKEAGFSLRLPQDWTVSPPQKAAYGLLYHLGPAPLARSGPANSSIVIADAASMTITQVAVALQCGGGCAAPTFTQVVLRNHIPARYAVIGGQGAPTTQWYFIEHNNKIIALSLHDPDQPTQALDAIIQSLTFGPIVESGGEENPAAQAARQSLAHELGLNPYVVLLESSTSIQWPDGCLGIYKTGQMCTQQITPGFVIILSALGKLYQFNTDENGAQVSAVPGLAAPVNDLVLTWHTDGQCQTAMLRPEASVTSGPCNGQLMTYTFSSDTPQAVQDLITFAATYAPVYAETPAGQLNFHGTGSQTASVAEQRMLAEWAHWVIDAAVAGRTSATDRLALAWHREGGIAAFCDDLAVYTTGFAQATACKGNQPQAFGRRRLTANQLAQLYQWVDNLHSFNLQQANSPRASDTMTITLLFNGNGSQTANENEKQAIKTFAGQLYVQFSTPISATPPVTITPVMTATAETSVTSQAQR